VLFVQSVFFASRLSPKFPILSPMSSTFYSIHHHVVFSTKNRRPFLRPSWRADLFAYLGSTVGGLGGVAEIINGVEDHVHLLLSLKTTHAPSELVRELKKSILGLGKWKP
jgi:REP element-mobilizing transposase RayT